MLTICVGVFILLPQAQYVFYITHPILFNIPRVLGEERSSAPTVTFFSLCLSKYSPQNFVLVQPISGAYQVHTSII